MNTLLSFLKKLLNIFSWQKPITQRIRLAKKKKVKTNKKVTVIKKTIPIYPSIGHKSKPTNATKTVKTKRPSNYVTPSSISPRKKELLRRINQVFFTNKARIDDAIRYVQKKYPTKNELEVLEMVVIIWCERR